MTTTTITPEEIKRWLREQIIAFNYRCTPFFGKHPEFIGVSAEMYDALADYVLRRKEVLGDDVAWVDGPLLFRGIPLRIV